MGRQRWHCVAGDVMQHRQACSLVWTRQPGWFESWLARGRVGAVPVQLQHCMLEHLITLCAVHTALSLITQHTVRNGTKCAVLSVEWVGVWCQMIHLPIYRHARRFLASMVVFGSIVLVMLWLPVQLVRYIFPKFLPFHVMLSRLAQASVLSGCSSMMHW